MTLSIHEQEDIRRMYAKGATMRSIASETGHSRNTVKKYVDIEDLSPQPPVREWRVGKTMEPYAETVDSWLEADQKAPRKQRHTAQRVFDRLVSEHGFEGEYSHDMSAPVA